MSTRRSFIAILPLAGVSVLAACGDKAPAPAPAPATPSAPATTGSMVDPSDPVAAALGYVADATTAKDPKYVAGSACANCALFGGKVGDAAGSCPLYVGKLVAATGWCTSHVKKG
jgi:predicted small lipoprotein YifL